VANAALGLRAHSGWAVLVVLAGPSASPAVAERRRVGLSGPGIPKQPYHAAENLSLEKAKELIQHCVRGSRRLARQAFRETIEDVHREGHAVVACGQLLASGRPLPGLAAVLASHALIHAADGEHFREAIAHAAAQEKLRVTSVREKEIWARASAALKISIAELQRRIADMGKELGPPWAEDQKLAALAAWVALGTAE
jgi:hypothetical protein